MYDIWAVPIVVLIIMMGYVFTSLRIAYRKQGLQKEVSTPHSERSYRAFEFFFAATVAIVGGIGYLKISVMQNDPSLARQAMTGLAALQYLSSCFLLIAVTVHLGFKFEHAGSKE